MELNQVYQYRSVVVAKMFANWRRYPNSRVLPNDNSNDRKGDLRTLAVGVNVEPLRRVFA